MNFAPISLQEYRFVVRRGVHRIRVIYGRMALAAIHVRIIGRRWQWCGMRAEDGILRWVRYVPICCHVLSILASHSRTAVWSLGACPCWAASCLGLHDIRYPSYALWYKHRYGFETSNPCGWMSWQSCSKQTAPGNHAYLWNDSMYTRLRPCWLVLPVTTKKKNIFFVHFFKVKLCINCRSINLQCKINVFRFIQSEYNYSEYLVNLHV